MKSSHPRLLFVISTLQAGGAERVMSLLVNHFAAAGAETHLTLLAGQGVSRHYEVPPSVTVHEVGPPACGGAPGKGLVRSAARVLGLRRILESVTPDAVVSFMDQNNVTSLMASAGRGVPVVISERVNPLHHDLSFPWRLARDLSYRRCAVLVVQTEEIAEIFRRKLGRKVAVIPNPVPPAARLARLGGTRLVAVGRLHRQKGFDLLVAAFAAVTGDFPEWRLDIFGEGQERENLARLAGRLGVGERVRFRGITGEIGNELASSDLFALPSRFEGFPNALAEAMAAGLPVVASRCSGNVDMVQDGESGILVPCEDVGALKTALRTLMEDEALRRRLGQNARAVTETFGVERIMKLWEEVIDAAVCPRP